MKRSLPRWLWPALAVVVIALAAGLWWRARPRPAVEVAASLSEQWREGGALGPPCHTWWSARAPHARTPSDLRDAAAASERACTKQPGGYAPLLAAPESAADPQATTVWAAETLGMVHHALQAPAGDAPCLLPTWQPSARSPKVTPSYVRWDGALVAPGRPPVPTYLFLPNIGADAPFPPRGAVLTIHGHDGGRRELVERPDDYQKAIAHRLAEAGYVVLACDNVSWGKHDPKGDGKGKHPSDWSTYAQPDATNGFITWVLTDLRVGLSLLAGLHVAPNPASNRWEPAAPRAERASPAVSRIGVSGLSFGGEMAAFLLLDPRPEAYVIAGGLIDTCDVRATDHHDCQAIPAFEGVVALWDFILAAAWLERPTPKGPRQPAILVQQGNKDRIYRSWSRAGVAALERGKRALGLARLAVEVAPDGGHTYDVDSVLRFFAATLGAPAAPAEPAPE
jgi:dienelactone hydrolase